MNLHRGNLSARSGPAATAPMLAAAAATAECKPRFTPQRRWLNYWSEKLKGTSRFKGQRQQTTLQQDGTGTPPLGLVVWLSLFADWGFRFACRWGWAERDVGRRSGILLDDWGLAEEDMQCSSHWWSPVAVHGTGTVTGWRAYCPCLVTLGSAYWVVGVPCTISASMSTRYCCQQLHKISPFGDANSFPSCCKVSVVGSYCTSL